MLNLTALTMSTLILLATDRVCLNRSDRPERRYGPLRRGCDVLGGTLYVADMNAFQIFDVRDRTKPVLVGSVPMEGSAHEVRVVGTLAYVAAGFGGLQIFDVSEPDRPNSSGNTAGSVKSRASR